MVTEVGIGLTPPAQQSCLDRLQRGCRLVAVGPVSLGAVAQLGLQRCDLAVQQADLVGEGGGVDLRPVEHQPVAGIGGDQHSWSGPGRQFGFQDAAQPRDVAVQGAVRASWCGLVPDQVDQPVGADGGARLQGQGRQDAPQLAGG